MASRAGEPEWMSVYRDQQLMASIDPNLVSAFQPTQDGRGDWRRSEGYGLTPIFWRDKPGGKSWEEIRIEQLPLVELTGKSGATLAREAAPVVRVMDGPISLTRVELANPLTLGLGLAPDFSLPTVAMAVQQFNDPRAIEGTLNTTSEAIAAALRGDWASARAHWNYEPSPEARAAIYERINPAPDPRFARIDAVRNSGLAGISTLIGHLAGASNTALDRLAQGGELVEGAFGQFGGFQMPKADLGRTLASPPRNNKPFSSSEVLRAKWGYLSAAERQMLIASKAEAAAGRWVNRYEASLRASHIGLNPHFAQKHGPDILLRPNLEKRAIDGTHPRTGATPNPPYPQTSSQFGSWVIEMTVLNEAVTRELRGLPAYNFYTAQGNPAVIGRIPTGAGWGFSPNNSAPSSPIFRPQLNGWIVRFDSALDVPFSAYPTN